MRAEDAVRASTSAVTAPSDEQHKLKRPRCDDTVNDGPSASKRPRCDEIVSDDAIFEHGLEVLECDRCEMYFTTQEQLDRHEAVCFRLVLISTLYCANICLNT